MATENMKGVSSPNVILPAILAEDQSEKKQETKKEDDS